MTRTSAVASAWQVPPAGQAALLPHGVPGAFVHRPLNGSSSAAIATVNYTPDGTRLAAGGADSHVRIFASEGGQLLEDVTIAASPATLTFAPFILTVLGAVVLREPVGIRRWTAVIIGFLGAILWIPRIRALLATCMQIYPVHRPGGWSGIWSITHLIGLKQAWVIIIWDQRMNLQTIRYP